MPAESAGRLVAPGRDVALEAAHAGPQWVSGGEPLFGNQNQRDIKCSTSYTIY